MKKTLSRQDFEVIVDGQSYFVDFDYEETFYRNHSADRYQEPEDITTSEETTFGDIVSYDDENNKIVSNLEDLPKKHQQVIIQKVQEDCNDYAGV